MKKFLLTIGLTASTLCISAATDIAYPLSYNGLMSPDAAPKYKIAAQAPSIISPLADDEQNAEPVFDRPEGTSKLYSRNSKGYANASGAIMLKDDRGLAVEIVTAEDGTVWMNNPFSQYNCGSWLKCTIEGDVLTIPLPQPVAKMYNGADDYTYYATRMTYDSDKEWFYTTEDQNYTFKIEGDKITDTTNGDLLGMCLYALDTTSPVQKYIYSWAGYGDYYLTMTEHTALPLTAPEGIDMDSNWALVRYAEGHYINLGFDDDKNVWIQGMLQSLPYAWTKGTLGEDNVYNFESEQYLGVDPQTRHITYFAGGSTEKRYDEVNNVYIDVQGVIPSLSMKYFPDSKVMVANSGENILITTNTIKSGEGLAYIYLYDDPSLVYQDRQPGVPPRPIRVTGYLPYNEQVYYGGVSFDLPIVDIAGMMIDPSKLSYEMWVDDEIFTFYPDEYRSLTRPTTRIGYYYSDGLDFMCQGVDHILYFFFQDAESIKIRTVYTEGGEETYSEFVDITKSAIKNIEADHGAVVKTEYYDLTGARINNPANTICIVRTTYSDGTVKATKQIFK